VSSAPALDVDPPSGTARGVALILHGGREHGRSAVTPYQLAVVRMRPFAHALRVAGARHGLAVARLRYTVRGWNGEDRSPVADVRWALRRVADRFGEVPVALIGHSMGGRAAIHAADNPGVTTVVGLAPWIAAGDAVEPLAGRRVLLAHGSRDRITSPRASAGFARRASGVADSIAYVEVTGEGHAMLRRAGLWHEMTTRFVLAALLGHQDVGHGSIVVMNVLRQALAGEPSFIV
jgi:pimeloyl-ACP methyl ester carboxylesterase